MEIVSETVRISSDIVSKIKPARPDSNVRALLPVYEETATGYYRFLLPLLEMRDLGHAGALISDELSGNEKEQAIQWANIIVLGRTSSDDIIKVTTDLRQFGTRLVVDQDDYPEAVLDTEMATIISSWTDEAMEKNQKIIQEADLVTVPVPYLKEVYSTIRRGPIAVLPNCIDSVNPRWNFKREKVPGKTVIGWMGGFVHISESDFAAEVIKRVLDKCPNAVFKAVGFVDEWMQELPQERRILEPGAFGISGYPKRMADMDIGIAPLADNDFNRGKSDLKFLEYTMAGVLPVVQDFGPYKHLPKSVALHCDTVDEWVECIVDLCENPKRIRHEYVKAMSYVLNQRNIYANSSKWYQCYKELIM